MGWFSDEGDLARAFKAWAKLGVSSPLPSSPHYKLRTVAEAKAFCRALASPHIYARAASGGIALYDLLTFFQWTGSEEAERYVRDHGLPILRRILTRALQEHGATDGKGVRGRGHVHAFLVKILCMYHQRGDVQLIAQAARDPRLSNGFLWQVIFEIIADGHPDAVEICERLADPLPGGEMLANYLEFANRLGREGRISRHPFDNAAGIARLSMLMSDAGFYSSAILVASSIPFLDPHARETLLDEANRHADVLVRIEAAWAMAKLDMDAGRARLVEFCRDPRYSKLASIYLDELGLAELAPAETRQPDFEAMARMCRWLAHPNEYARPPDEIVQYDTRELNWPPGGQRHRFWLFKYRYGAREGREESEGIGMVGGGTTFSLGVSADLMPEDVYGLHCSHEMSSDPRVTDRRSAAIGRKLIAELNPDFPAA